MKIGESKMNSANVREIKEFDEAVRIIQELSCSEFVHFDNYDDLASFTKKQLDHGHLLVQFQNERPVGYLCFYSNDQTDKTGYITAITIADIGIAKGRVLYALAKEGLQIGIRDGMNKVMIQVNKNNEHAVRMYERLGFKNVYEEDGQDVWMKVDMDEFMGKFRIKVD